MAVGTLNPERARLHLIAASAPPLIVLGALGLLPKDPSYAAHARLLMTAIALAAILGGIVALTLSYRRYGDAALRARYRTAPSAMRDTMKFLLQECQLGRRGRLELLILAVLASACWEPLVNGLSSLSWDHFTRRAAPLPSSQASASCCSPCTGAATCSTRFT